MVAKSTNRTIPERDIVPFTMAQELQIRAYLSAAIKGPRAFT
jgi:hypothetical protein